MLWHYHVTQWREGRRLAVTDEDVYRPRFHGPLISY
jgi:hypothetical protein